MSVTQHFLMMEDGGESTYLIKTWDRISVTIWTFSTLETSSNCLQSYTAKVHGRSCVNFLTFWSTNICCLSLVAGSTWHAFIFCFYWVYISSTSLIMNSSVAWYILSDVKSAFYNSKNVMIFWEKYHQWIEFFILAAILDAMLESTVEKISNYILYIRSKHSLQLKLISLIKISKTYLCMKKCTIKSFFFGGHLGCHIVSRLFYKLFTKNKITFWAFLCLNFMQ